MPVLSELQSATNLMLQVFLMWEFSCLGSGVSRGGYLEGSGPAFNRE